MNYLSLPLLESAIGAATCVRLLDDDKDGVADASVVTELAADVQGVINGYLLQAFPSVAFFEDAPTPQIFRFAKDIGACLAYERRTEFINDRGENPCTPRYKRAIDTLKLVAAGKFRLDPSPGGATPPVAIGGEVRTGTYANVAVGPGRFKDGTGAF